MMPGYIDTWGLVLVEKGDINAITLEAVHKG
jgi:hypothetical protein